MSSMGYAPWYDDIGADWLEGTMTKAKLPELVREILLQPVNEVSLRQIRAAAFLLIVLSAPGIWPYHLVERDLDLAIEKLDECLTIEKDADFYELIQKERDYLKMQRQHALNVKRVEAITELWRAWLAP